MRRCVVAVRFDRRARGPIQMRQEADRSLEGSRIDIILLFGCLMLIPGELEGRDDVADEQKDGKALFEDNQFWANRRNHEEARSLFTAKEFTAFFEVSAYA